MLIDEYHRRGLVLHSYTAWSAVQWVRGFKSSSTSPLKMDHKNGTMEVRLWKLLFSIRRHKTTLELDTWKQNQFPRIIPFSYFLPLFDQSKIF